MSAPPQEARTGGARTGRRLDRLHDERADVWRRYMAARAAGDDDARDLARRVEALDDRIAALQARRRRVRATPSVDGVFVYLAADEAPRQLARLRAGDPDPELIAELADVLEEAESGDAATGTRADEAEGAETGGEEA